MRSPGLVALALVVATVACDNSSSNSSSLPLAPASMTDVFTGTVAAGDSDFHNFTVTQTGSVLVTLTAAGPPPTITEGVGIGVPSASSCSVFAADAGPVTAGATAQLSGILNAGTYCVEVFDLGNQAVAITYSVTVAHP